MLLEIVIHERILFCLFSRFQKAICGCWVIIQIVQKIPDILEPFRMALSEDELALRLENRRMLSLEKGWLHCYSTESKLTWCYTCLTRLNLQALKILVGRGWQGAYVLPCFS